ncbi:hypothetical protein VNI00_002507 [Paramarasmius palmivorus]|uniref:Uncharacterized protein n=1 Tax=Paramarasmius palmivorus TaxID=297713 RepID=A0AAW0E1G5_9AGAR
MTTQNVDKAKSTLPATHPILSNVGPVDVHTPKSLIAVPSSEGVNVNANEREQCFTGGPVSLMDYPTGNNLPPAFRSRAPPVVHTLLPRRSGVLIPKPRGEVAHPKKGGYSLEATLINNHRWSKPGYDMINSQTKVLASQILDATKNYMNQDEASKKHICELLIRDFPFLSDYVNCWPIRDMMKAYLKYQNTKRRMIRA